MLQLRQLVFYLTDLFSRGFEQLIFFVRKLIFGILYRVQQKISVVFSIFQHGCTLVSLHVDLFPQIGILRKNLVLLLHQLLIRRKCLLGIFCFRRHRNFIAALICIPVVLCAAGCKRKCQQYSQSQFDPFLFVHFDSSIFVFFVVFFVVSFTASFVVSFAASFPSPRP